MTLLSQFHQISFNGSATGKCEIFVRRRPSTAPWSLAERSSGAGTDGTRSGIRPEQDRALARPAAVSQQDSYRDVKQCPRGVPNRPASCSAPVSRHDKGVVV